MIELCFRRTKILLSPFFFAVVTLFLIYDRSGIALEVLLFSFLHEMAHIAIMVILKAFPRKIELSFSGIHAEIPDSEKEIKISVLAAGFLLNFIFAILFYLFEKTETAYINAAIGIFTAFPLPCSDGGEILKEIFEDNCPKKIFLIFGLIAIFFMLFLGIKTSNLFFLIPILFVFSALWK